MNRMKLDIVAEPRLSGVDMLLLVVFFLGIYLGVMIQITPKIPFPAAPAGVAGMFLLWRRRDNIVPAHLAGLFGVVVLYLAASLTASDIGNLPKRFTGLVQLTYSLVIGYAMFLTILQASRGQIARLFLGFSLFILVGSLLESYAGMNVVSDAVRNKIYDSGIYDADLRDQILYGKVRPKLFTSEPSAVTFGYTFFTFAWFMTTLRRQKLLWFLLLLGAGLVAMPGPTLLLSLLLLPPYYLLVLPKTPPIGRFGSGYRVAIILFGGILLAVFAVIGATIYAERLGQIMNGNDPSFFYRVIGPALVAFGVIQHYPWAGAGLTGEAYIADLVMNIFVSSSHFSAGWRINKISEVLTNYFWLHWIYLGFVWGAVILAGLSGWLRMLGIPSVLFCWLVWIVFGQASGAYVAPKTWTVLLLAGALSMLHQRVPVQAAATAVQPSPVPLRPRRLRSYPVPQA
jgi:hypothetical protein